MQQLAIIARPLPKFRQQENCPATRRLASGCAASARKVSLFLRHDPKNPKVRYSLSR
jgi:hypothetical protein